MNHLLPHVAEIATKSKEERIYYIQSRFWIPYTKAREYLALFHKLVKNPKGDRMPNYLLVGTTNNGKTHILREFEKQYQPRMIPNVGTQLDVLYVQAPTKADESKLFNKILHALNVPFNLTEKVDKKYYRLIKEIDKLQLKVLIIDEIHNIIASTYAKQREFLIILKSLANDLRIVIICAGTHEAQRVMANDSQMANRFKPLVLKDWRLDSEDEAKEFLELLMTFEELLPLKEPSNLPSLAAKIHKMGEGLIGEYSDILKLSAIYAIEHDLEKITEDMLDKINFIPPSLRTRTKFD